MKLNELHYVCFDETEQLQGIFGMMFKTEEEIAAVLEQRRQNLPAFESKYKSGVLKLFAEHAVSPMKGGYMK